MIARNNGPLLLELKEIVPHGEFKTVLLERFPRKSYSKLNRWMFLAKHESEIEGAIEKYPDVAWGPKKMTDYLKGVWVPEEEDEDDEEDAWGVVTEPSEAVMDENESEVDGLPEPEDDEEAAPDATSLFAVGALSPELATAIKKTHEGDDQGDSPVTTPASGGSTVPPGATAGPVTQAVRKPPKTSKRKERTQPAVNRAEYEVEVRLGFKLSVPEDVTAEQIGAALRDITRWDVSIKTPFGYEMSEKGIVVRHILPWLHGMEPKAVPNSEVGG